MEEIEGIYRRDDFDLTLSEAAALEACATYLESVLLQQACTGEWTGYLPPQQVLSLRPQDVIPALDILHRKAYKNGHLVDESYLRLLARIGTPSLIHSSDADGSHTIEHWPQAAWRATRKDLLHFYLLVKAEYVDLKAKLQDRPVSPEAVHGLVQAGCRQLGRQFAYSEGMQEFKAEVVHSWQHVEWSPPEESPPGATRVYHPRRGLIGWFSWLFS